MRIHRGHIGAVFLTLASLLATEVLAIDTAEVKSAAGKASRDTVAKGATASPAAKSVEAEVNHLFAYLEKSGCRFERNGKWHTSQEAADHLRKKHAHLKKRGQIASAEDFIAKAATGSSMSGRPYRVQCGDGEPEASAKWLGEELERFRKR